MARKRTDTEPPTESGPTTEDVVAWLVEEGRSVAAIRADLLARGLTPQVAGAAIARAMRQIERDDVPTPPALERARLRHLVSRALLEGDSRAYRALAGDLQAATPAAVDPPTSPDPDALRRYALRVTAELAAGRISGQRSRELLAPVATLTQVDYAAAAAAGKLGGTTEADPGTVPETDEEAEARLHAALRRGKC